MKSPAFPVLALILSVAAPSGFPAHFRCGFVGTKSDEVTLMVPRPPDAFLQHKTVMIVMGEQAQHFQGQSGLKAGIEKALSPDFSVVTTKPEAVITVSVTAWERPTTKTYTVTETRHVKVGQRQAKNRDGSLKVNKKGEPVMEDVYEDRLVPVQYWEGRGSIAASVKVENAARVLLDGFAPRAEYSQKVELSVNGVAGGGAIGDLITKPSKSPLTNWRNRRAKAAPSAAALPNEDGIAIALIEDIAEEFTPRYRKTRVPEEFKLACTDPLRPGNDAAKGGDWAAALKLWEAAKMKKKDEEGDRVFNIAAANEALAYETYAKEENPDAAEPQFAKALELYEQARQLDPKEKYITQSSGRVQRAKANIENAKKQYAAQQLTAMEAIRKVEEAEKAREAEKLKAEAERMKKEAEEKALLDPRPDTAPEASFRNIARAKFRPMPLPIANDEAEKLVQMGGMAFKLQPPEAKRVVFQEKKRREEMDGKLAMYKDSFAAFAQDKVISADERKMLAEVSQNLGLGTDDTGPVEAGFTFTEPAKAAPPKPAPVKPAPVKPAPKPAAQPAKPAVPATKPAIVPQSKPAAAGQNSAPPKK